MRFINTFISKIGANDCHIPKMAKMAQIGPPSPYFPRFTKKSGFSYKTTFSRTCKRKSTRPKSTKNSKSTKPIRIKPSEKDRTHLRQFHRSYRPYKSPFRTLKIGKSENCNFGDFFGFSENRQKWGSEAKSRIKFEKLEEDGH